MGGPGAGYFISLCLPPRVPLQGGEEPDAEDWEATPAELLGDLSCRGAAAATGSQGCTGAVLPARLEEGGKSPAPEDPGRTLCPGRNAQDRGWDCIALQCAQPPAPGLLFLYLDHQAGGDVLQHHAVAGLVGCLAPWTMSFHKLLFKFTFIQRKQNRVVLLACQLHCSDPCSGG